MPETESPLTAEERLQIAAVMMRWALGPKTASAPGNVIRQGYFGPHAYLIPHEGSEHVIFVGGLDEPDEGQ